MELLYALRNAGVDILQTANSFTVHNGLTGMQTTLNNIRSVGIETTGSYANSQEYQDAQGFIMCEIQGIRVAIVAFTKGMGSRGIPATSEECVNLLYEDFATTYQKIDRDRISDILDNVNAEDPDLTIALLHWGSEFNDNIHATQESIVKLMQGEGVDVIIGTHPHRVQKVDFNQEKGTLVAYSLGDFFGDAKESGTNYSIILDLEITRDNDTGKTKVTGFDYIPIYTLKENEVCDGQRRVVRINEAIWGYDTNFVDRITKEAYDSMKFSLERIEARVTGK
jgi:poly-gamma-glutamate synthesis protein (capsule biosynthesis protein)